MLIKVGFIGFAVRLVDVFLKMMILHVFVPRFLCLIGDSTYHPNTYRILYKIGTIRLSLAIQIIKRKWMHAADGKPLRPIPCHRFTTDYYDRPHDYYVYKEAKEMCSAAATNSNAKAISFLCSILQISAGRL